MRLRPGDTIRFTESPSDPFLRTVWAAGDVLRVAIVRESDDYCIGVALHEHSLEPWAVKPFRFSDLAASQWAMVEPGLRLRVVK